MKKVRDLLEELVENEEIDYTTSVFINVSEDEQVGYWVAEDLLDSEDDCLDMDAIEYDKTDDGDLKILVG